MIVLLVQPHGEPPERQNNECFLFIVFIYLSEAAAASSADFRQALQRDQARVAAGLSENCDRAAKRRLSTAAPGAAEDRFHQMSFTAL
jgi:hypothetical protein